MRQTPFDLLARALPRHPLALLVCAGLHGFAAQAQSLLVPPMTADDDRTLSLKSSDMLQDLVTPSIRSRTPTFLFGEQVYGRPDLETVLEGKAELRRQGMVIKADRLEYYQPDDLAKARGHVLVNRQGSVYEGPLLELKLDAFEGFFHQPSYRFLQNNAHGEAERIDFLDEQRAVVRNATFTTCTRQPGPSWMPDWILHATTLRLDNEEDVGTAEGAVLSFMGAPVLATPYISFPLSGKRKSGFLPPILGLDSVDGLSLAVPYYWNIAPNRDATLTPTVLTRRGVMLDAEFRYLEAGYSGELRFDWMPADRLRQRSRWGLGFKHRGTLASSWTDKGVSLDLNLNRVSDDNYWRDFTENDTSATQRLLANDVKLSWSNGRFANHVRMLKWQTLQDPLSPITPPYDRLPQLSTRYTRSNVQGFDLSVDADYTHFVSDRSRTGQSNAERAFVLTQLSYPWSRPGGFLTPKLQLHATSYQFDAPLMDGARSATRAVPTFSLDSGLVFERGMQLFDRPLRQTLEPRAFFVSTPTRDQSLLPNYDSGANDFSMATIYAENAFVGNDRISDGKLLTLGVTSRFLDAQSGAETLRLGLAQRYRFEPQTVTLPGGAAVRERFSDILLAANVNWDPRWAFDASLQFNPATERTVRSTLAARYNPGPYRVVTATHRYQQSSTEQLDLGWQWPIGAAAVDATQGRWYSVGRLNYNLNERKLVDAVLGLEYDACCWRARAVLEQKQIGTTAAKIGISFQLEFVGFTRLSVGNNPLKTLKENIPNYRYLGEATSPSSRFSQYD